MDAQLNPSHQNDSQYALLGKWNLFYHLPQDKSWDLASYKVIMSDIDTAEKTVGIVEALSNNIIKHCMLFVMRVGISPMWEDPRNRNGGCFSYKVINRYVPEVWKTLFYALCGETLCKDPKHNHLINVITISPKKNFCIIKVWMTNRLYQNPTAVTILSPAGCLFKNHEPEH
jgi:hypothetical protein